MPNTLQISIYLTCVVSVLSGNNPQPSFSPNIRGDSHPIHDLGRGRSRLRCADCMKRGPEPVAMSGQTTKRKKKERKNVAGSGVDDNEDRGSAACAELLMRPLSSPRELFPYLCPPAKEKKENEKDRRT